jgi:hypothetical protein
VFNHSICPEEEEERKKRERGKRGEEKRSEGRRRRGRRGRGEEEREKEREREKKRGLSLHSPSLLPSLEREGRGEEERSAAATPTTKKVVRVVVPLISDLDTTTFAFLLSDGNDFNFDPFARGPPKVHKC